MRVRLVRRPGQHGTRAYVERYGNRLVCVRYRYDTAAGRRYKTVEIIVEEAPWAPAGGTFDDGHTLGEPLDDPVDPLGTAQPVASVERPPAIVGEATDIGPAVAAPFGGGRDSGSAGRDGCAATPPSAAPSLEPSDADGHRAALSGAAYAPERSDRAMRDAGATTSRAASAADTPARARPTGQSGERTAPSGHTQYSPETLVAVVLPEGRAHLRPIIIAEGGVYREFLGVWVLPYRLAVRLKLTALIVDSVARLAEEWNLRSGRR